MGPAGEFPVFMAGAAHLRDSAGGGVRQLVPRNGSPLGDRKRLAAMIAPQVHVMVRDQGDGKSVLVAIEAGEPLENRLEHPRSLGSKVHAASLSERDRESVLYTDKVYARRPSVCNTASRATASVELRPAQPVSERRALTQAPGPQPGFGNEGDRMTDKEWAGKSETVVHDPPWAAVRASPPPYDPRDSGGLAGS